ncbi:hypothetical protein FB639_003453 [Coemansia asiatica]|nr:hypothetical protein FB639_003453 [Coemansia asiatica]
MFRVVVLEDEFLEEFFSETVPASFRFTDGVELANPLRAISTHLPPATPLTPRAAESASARLLAGGRSVAEGMSVKLAQTIALGSQFVDRRVLTPIVRNAAQQQADAEARSRTDAPGFSVSNDLAAATQLSNAAASAREEALADEMAQMMLLRDQEAAEYPGPETYATPRNSPLELQVQPDKPKWSNAPLEPKSNAPLDPYENLLDEVDELLGEIKDDDEAGTISQPLSALASPVSSPQKTAQPNAYSNNVQSNNVQSNNVQSKKAANDLDFEIDDDDDDDDLTHLLKD